MKYVYLTIVSALLGTTAATAQTAPPRQDEANVDDIVVTAQRSRSDIVASGHQLTTIDQSQIELARSASDTLATILAKTVPGLADSSRTITDFGQTLRGRGALILVDGVPYNTNRDSARGLIGLEPSDIAQVQVLRGSSAMYGSGATGGIISINTRPAGGPLRAETVLAGTGSLSNLTTDSLGGRVQQFVSGSAGSFDFIVNGGYQRIGGGFDGNGNRRAPEPSQGDLFDSNVWNVGGKAGLRVGGAYVQLSASHYRADQHTDFVSDPAVDRLPAGAAAARPLRGIQLANQNQLYSTVLTANLAARDVLGSRLTALGYYRDFFSRYTPFDARGIATRGRNVDQVTQNSRVFGGRLTIETPLGERSSLTWGGDLTHEQSDMPLDVFDPVAYDASRGLVFNRIATLLYMPELTTLTHGGFVQAQHRFADWLAVEGGARYDRARARFDDFIPLSQSRAARPGTIPGGTISYGAWTFNGSATVTPVAGQDFFATFSQGFQLPDIGLQLRNANLGFNIRNSDLQPVRIDSYEVGWRGRFGKARMTASAFRTTSELGDVQSLNNGLILVRTAERIRGLEGSLDVGEPIDRVRAGATATWIRGRERPANAAASRPMTGYRIPPLKVTAYVEVTPVERLDIRFQGLLSGDRDYRLNGVQSFGRRKVEQYTVFDVTGRWRPTDRDTITAGIENLFNTQYFPVYSQLLRSNLNSSRVPANGATLTIGYRRNW
ncbi:TonB-dependent siderophore receptor [Arthrobacter sp. TPD3018]|uniref:TonB-dependent receptor n=1 Tax=Bacteria TaxID=2 RepID=UPI000D51058F|nr:MULTISPECIES: TonB-dependent siderophore receptor [Bacteria]PVE59776.1 TonB-dependent siderophore receptor [Sphingomonas sp. TPD3009]PVE61294.1 TonB-dependent siderophore receptor [Arthrobacter sp. TPD3018]PVE85787.1 TonB-dependent siderophore receptor [Sphingomonas melonis]